MPATMVRRASAVMISLLKLVEAIFAGRRMPRK